MKFPNLKAHHYLGLIALVGVGVWYLGYYQPNQQKMAATAMPATTPAPAVVGTTNS